MSDAVTDDAAFDRALIASAFDQAAARGWPKVSVAAAARAANLPLERARARFPCRHAILLRFGQLCDQSALAAAASADDPTVRDRLFDMVMRRIDVLQAHRAGVLALFHALPRDPATTMMLAAASLCSMGWLLEGAGIDATGPLGQLRRKGFLAVWLWTVRAWRTDDSEDLAATMAALDQALERAGQAESWLRARRHGAAPRSAPSEPPATTLSPSGAGHDQETD